MGPADDDKLASVHPSHSTVAPISAQSLSEEEEVVGFQPICLVGMLLVVLLGIVMWLVVRIPEPAAAETGHRLQGPIQLRDDTQTLPADSWRALPVQAPHAGTLKVSLEVTSGNPVEIFLTDDSGIAALKDRKFSSIKSEPQFYAETTKSYRRAGLVREGTYYFVIRDPSLGVFSAHSSDIALNIRLEP